MKLAKLETGLIIDLESIDVIIPVKPEEDLCDIFFKSGTSFSYNCHEELSNLMEPLLIKRKYNH